MQIELHEAVSSDDYRSVKGLFSRLRVRWKMYGGFAWSSWRVAKRKAKQTKINLVTTNPFFLPALVARASGGRNATINLLYDLYPEALIQAGTIAADSWVERRCAALTRYALRECTVTVFLGCHLQAYAEATYGPARQATIIPVGADGSSFRDFPPSPPEPGHRPRILYCGQMGRMHDVDTLLGCWTSPEAAACDWRFHASGAGYAKLKACNRDLRSETGDLKPEVPLSSAPQVSGFRPPPSRHFGSALGDADWIAAMRTAQVALVTIAPGAERVVMPSKTYSALVAGQAVLAICPRESDLADLVRKHDCGWVVEPGDTEGLRATLSDIAGNAALLQAKRERAYAAGHRFYDSTVVAKQWLALFENISTTYQLK